MAENDWEEERRAMSGLRLDDGEGRIFSCDMIFIHVCILNLLDGRKIFQAILPVST